MDYLIPLSSCSKIFQVSNICTKEVTCPHAYGMVAYKIVKSIIGLGGPLG